MSTKTTVFTILAVLGAALTVFANALGLALDPTKALAGVAAVLVYVFASFKSDIAGLNQPLIWKDPKVWLASIEAAIGALTAAGVTLPIPPEIIITVLAAIMGLLFKPAKIIAALKARRASMAGYGADKPEGIPTAGIIAVAFLTIGGLVWFITTLIR